MANMNTDFLYLSTDELELLCFCIGKQLVATEGASFIFSDTSVLSVDSDLRSDIPVRGDHGDTFDEVGIIQLGTQRVYSERGCSPKEINRNLLPVSAIVQKVYVLNESVLWGPRKDEDETLTFVHTCGIVFEFSEYDDEEGGDTVYYYDVRQENPGYTANLESRITVRERYELPSYRTYWNGPDVYSVSMIRVG